MKNLSAILGLVVLPLLATGCRDSESTGQGPGQALVPSLSGTDGCNGAAQAFSAGQVLTNVPLGTWVGDNFSQMAGARGGELLYLSGAAATIVEVDLTGGGVPLETVLVNPGVVQAVVDPLASGPAPILSGLTVLDSDTLAVMEHSFNVILLVSRSVPDTVTLLAGLPNTVPGLADGPAGMARFSFGTPSQLVATGSGQLFVADSANHVIRRVRDDIVSTLAGSGAPFFADGELATSLFDTPSGVSVTCSGNLLVTELGLGAAGGHRVREIQIGAESFFGQLGTVSTVAGDGTIGTTDGLGGLALVDSPMGIVTSATGEAYWVDGGSGVLRRWMPGTDAVDCPLWTDCAAAVAGLGNFTQGGVVSLVSSDGGILYALDASAGQLLRVTP
ncbi:MAG: hypothetical protein P1V81_12305 [Planctomycetota bacterium]|nr:hypothetical protein [Planctomycetota bacterium]